MYLRAPEMVWRASSMPAHTAGRCPAAVTQKVRNSLQKLPLPYSCHVDADDAKIFNNKQSLDEPSLLSSKRYKC